MLIPLSNQLSGAVAGRASGALIWNDKASLRAVFRGGSFVDGCGSAGPRRSQCRGEASGCLRRAAGCSLHGEKLVSSHTKGLCSGET